VEAIAAYRLIARTEGVLMALESSHAVAEVIKRAPGMAADKIIVVNISGRGDKDLFTLARAVGDDKFKQFLREEIHRV
jgi:tryptophan synthase beta chain